MKPRKRKKRFGSDSGQAMTEAVIMLSLLSFVWAMIGFTTFMAANGVQTAGASRLRAWMAGNAVSRSGEIDVFFFHQNGLLMDNSVTDRDLGSVPGLDAFVTAFANDAFFTKHASVQFGVLTAGAGSPYPFSFMDTQFPFMEESLLSGWLNVSTDCEWAHVNNTWANISVAGAISSLLGF